LIIIAGVVLIGMIAAFMFMKFMLNQSNAKMIEAANARHQKIKELNNQTNDHELVGIKTKKGIDDLRGDSDGAKVMAAPDDF